MTSRRPPRLPTFNYLGTYRYFVTCCTENRRVLFTDSALIDCLRLQILRSGQRWGFAILAYVFMPDHLHLLAEGTAETSDFRAFMKNLRKRTTLTHSKLAGSALWQDGFFERVLRSDEATEKVIDYIRLNPVRAGLVERVEEYPYTWSIRD